MQNRLRRERLARHVQTGLVLLAMVVLFAVTGYVLLGATGLAILIAMGFVMLLAVGQRELRVDTSMARPLATGDHAGIHGIVDRLAREAELPEKPEIYAVPVDEMNAATMGSEAKPILAITTPMLDRLTERELRAIAAHEISHLAQRDLAFFKLVTMLQVLTISVSRIGWLLLILFWPIALASGVRIPLFAIALLLGAPILSILLQAALSRARESAADVGAVELTGDPEGLALALAKIDRHRENLWRQVLPVPQRRRTQESVLRTHPAQEQRVAHLRELADTVER